jgi:hypothetical protein
MYVLKNEAKDLYVSMVRGDIALEQARDNRTLANTADRTLFVYAYSLPFWAAMSAVISNEEFYRLLEFTECMDQIIAPESMYYKLSRAYPNALGAAINKDEGCTRRQ